MSSKIAKHLTSQSKPLFVVSPTRQCGIDGDAELEKNEKATSSHEQPLVSAHISVAVTTTQQFEVPTLNVPDEADDSTKPTHLETGNARKLREEKTSTSYSNSTLTLVNAHLPEHKRVENFSLQLCKRASLSFLSAVS